MIIKSHREVTNVDDRYNGLLRCSPNIKQTQTKGDETIMQNKPEFING